MLLHHLQPEDSHKRARMCIHRHTYTHTDTCEHTSFSYFTLKYMYEQIFMRKYFRTPHFYKTNLRPQTFPYLKSENLTKHTYKKKKKKFQTSCLTKRKKKHSSHKQPVQCITPICRWEASRGLGCYANTKNSKWLVGALCKGTDGACVSWVGKEEYADKTK